jgi:hypothetical protein
MGLPVVVFRRCAENSGESGMTGSVTATDVSKVESDIDTDDDDDDDDEDDDDDDDDPAAAVAVAAAAAAATAAEEDELELCRRSNETLVAKASAMVEGTSTTKKVSGWGKINKNSQNETIGEAFEEVVDAGGQHRVDGRVDGELVGKLCVKVAHVQLVRL